MDKRTLLMGTALAALVAAAGCGGKTGTKGGEMAEGECHGVNACKGQGACGGAGHECAGQNSCKGKGWVKKTAAECKSMGGTFKAG